MIQLITPAVYSKYKDDLVAMRRLRYRIFRKRLGWHIPVSGEMQVDSFDACHPVYLLQRSDDGRLQGCVRLLPTTGPTMLRDIVPELLGGQPAPASETIWEASRFGLDFEASQLRSGAGFARATYELAAGMLEFGLLYHLTDIVGVIDIRLERILSRGHWPARRFGKPRMIGGTLAIAADLEISAETLARVRQAGGLESPAIATCDCQNRAS
jgi:N-acyl-L-homoserine lactone synthetase